MLGYVNTTVLIIWAILSLGRRMAMRVRTLARVLLDIGLGIWASVATIGFAWATYHVGRQEPFGMVMVFVLLPMLVFAWLAWLCWQALYRDWRKRA